MSQAARVKRIRQPAKWLRTFAWLVHKDLLRERRSGSAWPGTLLLGLVLVFVIAVQLDLAVEQKQRIGGGLLWLAVFFAGSVVMDRSFSSERGEGCWQALRLYPVDATTRFLAKLATNVLALLALQAVLIPAFVLLADLPLLERPLPLLLIVCVASLGYAAVGTVLAAMLSGPQPGNHLLLLVLLPLASPVILGICDATRLMLLGELGTAWWRWIQLLAAYAVLFTAGGALMFESALEE